MELQIQNEKIDIKKSLGSKRKTITIEKDFILPDSKPDIIKVQHESATAFIVKKENMENKLRIEGGISLRITYLTSEGKSRVLKTDDTFNEMIDIPGMTESSFINEKMEVTSIKINIVNERKLHFKVESVCQVSASAKESIEFIHEINPVHQLQTLNKTMRIDSFIGHGESKVSMKEKLDTESVQENIEIMKVTPEIRNIEKKMSYNKVLVKADCMVNCLYITESGMVHITKKEVPIMGFLDIDNVEDSNECNIEFSIRNISATESSKETSAGIDVEIEFNIIGDVYQSKEINLLEDLYCLNNKLEFKRQQVSLESWQRRVLQTSTIKQKMIVEDINQIYDMEYNILNTQRTGRYIEGEIQTRCLYSSFENSGINTKEETLKFQLTLEQDNLGTRIQIINSKSVILPDSSIDIELEVEVLAENASQEEIQLIKEVQIGEENSDDEYSMIIYFVKKGDSLWNIAKKFKSTVSEIASINEIKNEDKINIGDKLYIPRAI